MKLLALQNLPNRVRAGAIFDETPEVGRILIASGVARAYEPGPVSVDPPKRRYQRRDLEAED